VIQSFEVVRLLEFVLQKNTISVFLLHVMFNPMLYLLFLKLWNVLTISEWKFKVNPIHHFLCIYILFVIYFPSCLQPFALNPISIYYSYEIKTTHWGPPPLCYVGPFCQFSYVASTDLLRVCQIDRNLNMLH